MLPSAASTGTYMAHSPTADNPRWQTMREHVQGVSERIEAHVRYLARRLPHLMLHARLSAQVHDLGKYRDGYQMHRLQWHPDTAQFDPALPVWPVAHSDAGARLLQTEFCMVREVRSELPFVIASHHGALQDVGTLKARLDQTDMHELALLYGRAVRDTPELDALITGELPDLPLTGTARAHLIRMLLSALVDADRLDSENHASPSKAELRELYRVQEAEMSLLFGRLQDELEAKAAQDALNPKPINALRREMYRKALSHADLAPGFFSLTLPTGGSKTLTSLGFALQHAAAHGLRRVIYAEPFTTIIEQVAGELRRILEQPGEFKVLEHHSNFRIQEAENPAEEEYLSITELVTENWDVPVIVTTTVRLFQETLFGNRANQLRRLHNVSGSVIVLDEVQSLPAHLLQPTLDALQFLVDYAGCSVIFCTATPPALERRAVFPGLKGIRELVPDHQQYFKALQRVHYQFRSEPVAWAELAAELSGLPQVLCIVNTRQHAADLFKALGTTAMVSSDENYHLSTNMCPLHRQRTLVTIRARLAASLPCRMVSTQLIEAGVDVDFPAVYRALGPLESIVQAAGRCNREQRQQCGQVIIFVPTDNKLPQGDYPLRLRLAQTALKEGANLHETTVMREYFQSVYQRAAYPPEVTLDGGGVPFKEAHSQLYFQQIAETYQMITGDLVPVLIRGYEPEQVKALLGIICHSRSKQERQLAWRGLQQHTINIYAAQAAKAGELLTDVPELTAKAEQAGYSPPTLRQFAGVYDSRLGAVFGSEAKSVAAEVATC